LQEGGAVRGRTLRVLLALAPAFAAPTGNTQAQPEKDSPGLWPWASQSPATPPKVPPFEIPTFAGQHGDFKDAPSEWVRAPKIDGDAIFRAVVSCYPARSRWQIDLDLQAALRTSSAVDVTGTTIGRSMVGIVARMPIYSDSEMDRERQREYQRRLETASTIADFIGAIARRNAAVRTLSLSSMLEKRAQLRVREGIADADEQVKWLQKVIDTENELISAEGDIQKARLKLVALCRDDAADGINAFLTQLARLPEATKPGNARKP